MNTTSSRPATYVYGVTLAEPFQNGHSPLRVPGIGGRGDPVRTIVLRDLAAVVSDVPGLRMDLRRENLLDHQRVLEEVLRHSDVLPFSFGTVAGSDEEIREVLLRDGYDALCEQLEYVRGCVELEVKVFWEQERLFAEIAEENDEVRALRDTIPLLPDEEATLEKISLGELTAAEIELKSGWEADAMLNVLEPIAVEALVSSNLSETMLLNAAFLVERAREEEFDRAVAALAEAQGGRLIFNYVGPLPPYSFINLAFEAEG
ncbi:MAG: GvpL/GvpF family gas vesicle protein [Gemmatimonadaceae bacterium]